MGQSRDSYSRVNTLVNWKNRILEKEEKKSQGAWKPHSSRFGIWGFGVITWAKVGLGWPTPIALLSKVHMASLLCWIPSVPGTFLSRYPITLTSPTSRIFLLLFRLHTHRFTNHSLSTSHDTCCWDSWDSSEILEQALMINPITSAS